MTIQERISQLSKVGTTSELVYNKVGVTVEEATNNTYGRQVFLKEKWNVTYPGRIDKLAELMGKPQSSKGDTYETHRTAFYKTDLSVEEIQKFLMENPQIKIVETLAHAPLITEQDEYGIQQRISKGMTEQDAIIDFAKKRLKRNPKDNSPVLVNGLPVYFRWDIDFTGTLSDNKLFDKNNVMPLTLVESITHVL